MVLEMKEAWQLHCLSPEAQRRIAARHAAAAAAASEAENSKTLNSRSPGETV
jgi:hypothetical protein